MNRLAWVFIYIYLDFLELWGEEINAEKFMTVKDAIYAVVKRSLKKFEACLDSNPDLCVISAVAQLS